MYIAVGVLGLDNQSACSGFDLGSPKQDLWVSGEPQSCLCQTHAVGKIPATGEDRSCRML